MPQKRKVDEVIDLEAVGSSISSPAIMCAICLDALQCPLVFNSCKHVLCFECMLTDETNSTCVLPRFGFLLVFGTFSSMKCHMLLKCHMSCSDAGSGGEGARSPARGDLRGRRLR
ncbi:uncharacterized protein EV422DRAFT_528169 [Fimicolochytrium jonesii]|uniref:uncharacterized protein n=1 Tax=Fimicolochytrium jonesii TaxID=1396493 RepID=UPI0022FE793F|nr:uncharacterized protein EV422DRAFT_528169 [Fimicolochytrium jonesii]KAI8821443.1 hypothetical protein EV422DRAFT_528169 [Fimicolochytrium jonesii]